MASPHSSDAHSRRHSTAIKLIRTSGCLVSWLGASGALLPPLAGVCCGPDMRLPFLSTLPAVSICANPNSPKHHLLHHCCRQ